LDSFEKGDLVLGDALFGTYFLLLEMQKKKVDILFEQHGSRKKTTDFRKGKSLGTRDHLIDIKKPKKKPEWMDQEFYDQSPDFITIRELKINHKILISSILDPKIESRKSLCKLYKDRWHVELDFRNLKTTLGMNILSCKTPEMCEKEMWMHVLAHNIIRLLSAQSAFNFNLKPRNISFKHCLQVWLTYNQKGRRPDDAMFALISKRQVGNRPGRVEPRAVKRRPKPYKLLTVKREIAREEIRKNGHPKKQK
ncbi:MAG: transposase, partial [Saccharospirillaceae bacterium]|nr:transposase [Pseudomonadales bacterium]NRB79439.1 transposase [Saccharospirillaceae bacterium]